MVSPLRFGLVIDLGVAVQVPLRGPPLVGHGLAVFGIEVGRVGRQAAVLLPVDVVVEGADRLLAFVRDGDLRRFAERHGKPAIERLLRADRERAGFIEEVLAQPKAEEIPDGGFDGGQRIAVPESAEDQFLEVVAFRGGDGDPDVRDDAGPGRLAENARFAGLDAVSPAAVVIGARAVERRYAFLRIALQQRELGEVFGGGGAQCGARQNRQ